MELIIKGETLTEIHSKIVRMAAEIVGTGDTIIYPETTGSVEQDQAIVPTSTPSREDLKPKRTRKTKAEMAATSSSDLADGPANSRPVTAEVVEVPKQSTDSSGDDEAAKYKNFKENFTKIIFMMLQQQTIDATYIEAKQKFYNVSDILSIKKDDAMLEHFYGALRTEGKI